MGSSRSAGSGQSTEGNFPHNGPHQSPSAVQDTTKVGFSLSHIQCFLLSQGWEALALKIYFSVEFVSKPDKTHLPVL